MIKMDMAEYIFLMGVDFKDNLWKIRCMAQERLWWETEKLSTASGKITNYLKKPGMKFVLDFGQKDYFYRNWWFINLLSIWVDELFM